MNSIDMGIAICHIWTESKEFSFAKDDTAPKRNELVYVGTVI
jgi:hypothetical protein